LVCILYIDVSMRKAQRGACTNYRVYNKTKENVSALSANDPAEEALYAAAKSRFWSDVQRYRIAVTPRRAALRDRGCSAE